MAIIKVSGTSIQAAQDRAMPGDILDVVAGGYAGFSVTKQLTIVGDGCEITAPGNTVSIKAPGVVLKGLGIHGSTGQFNAGIFMGASDLTLEDVDITDGNCFGIRVYRTNGLKMLRGSIRKVAQGIEFNRSGAGSVIENVAVSDVDKMVVNDSTSGNDYGGNAYSFYHSTGPILIKGGSVSRARSISYGGLPASYDYGRDGAAFEFFGSGQGVTIDGVSVFDALHILETGKNSGDLDFANVVIRNCKFTGRTSSQVNDSTMANNGMLLRSAKNWTIEDNEWRNLDWWLINAESSNTNYAGAVSNIIVQRNKVWLKTGVNRWIHLGLNVTSSALQFASNQVYFPSGTVVAEVVGKGRTADRAQLESWTGWEKGSFWGPAPATAPVTATAPASAPVAAPQPDTTTAAAVSARDAAILETTRVKDLVTKAKTILQGV